MPRPLIALDTTLVGGRNTGDSSYWNGLLSGLATVDSEFDFLLLSDLPPPREFGERFRWVRLPRVSRRWFSLVTMPLSARRMGAQVFHTQYTLSPFAKNGVTTIHDVSFFVGPEWFRAKDRFLLQRFVPSSAKRAAKVITVSEAGKRDIVRYLGVAPDKVAVTYNAVSDIFKPVAEAERKAAQDKFSIRGPYLLALGSRWPRKNLRLAIAAVGLLPKNLEHKLIVVGKEGWGAEGGNERTISTGYLPDEMLPSLYSGADLFLFPSHYEGFGIPMLEAFACGTPVLSSAGGALPEVSGGAAEILIDMSPEAWSSKIVELLTDSSKLHAMRERGFARAKDFSWTDTARRTLEVYREVLK